MPATCPYPEPAPSSRFPPTSHFLKIHLNLSSHLRLGIQSGLFPLRFPLYTTEPKYLAADHGRVRTKCDNCDRTVLCFKLHILGAHHALKRQPSYARRYLGRALHVVRSACHLPRKQVSLGDIREECDVEYAGANCEGSTEASLMGESSQRFSGTPLQPCAHICHSALEKSSEGTCFRVKP